MSMKSEDEQRLESSAGNALDRCPKWHVIDARKDIDSTHQEILSIALSAIEECADKPIGRMWS